MPILSCWEDRFSASVGGGGGPDFWDFGVLEGYGLGMWQAKPQRSLLS